MNPPPNPYQSNPSHSNPYQSPPQAQPTNYTQAPINRENRHWITQLFIFSIISIVVGALEFLIGVLFLFSAVFFVSMAGADPRMNTEQASQMRTIMPIFLGIMGTLPLLAGLLRIVGSVYAMLYKNYSFAFATVLLGLVSSAGVYCLPTALILMIYGLVIFLQQPVKHVFKLRKSGMTMAEISQLVERIA